MSSPLLALRPTQTEWHTRVHAQAPFNAYICSQHFKVTGMSLGHEMYFRTEWKTMQLVEKPNHTDKQQPGGAWGRWRGAPFDWL